MVVVCFVSAQKWWRFERLQTYEIRLNWLLLCGDDIRRFVLDCWPRLFHFVTQSGWDDASFSDFNIFLIHLPLKWNCLLLKLEWDSWCKPLHRASVYLRACVCVRARSRFCCSRQVMCRVCCWQSSQVPVEPRSVYRQTVDPAIKYKVYAMSDNRKHARL